MRVLLIHQAFASDREPGGTRHFELGRRLAVQGDALTVVASQVSYLTGQRVNPTRKGVFYRERAGPIEVLRAYAPSVLHRSFLWRLVAFAAFALTSVWAGLRAGRVDLVMGTTPPIFQAVSAWLVATLRRKPFLLEVRDLWPEFPIAMGVLRQPLLKRLARWLERFLYRRADHLLVNSPAYRDYLLAKGVPAAKVTVIPNGVEARMFDPEATGNSIRRRFDLAGKFVVVYAGAHGMANDLGTVLKAAFLLRDRPEVHFLFVGDGKERPNLERAARHRALDNITFAGPIPKAQIPDVLAAADVCLAILHNIPMFTTTYPNKVFDYMAAGRPTLLAIDGVIRRVIEDAGGGVFVPPGDPTALAAAVRELHADRDRCAQMGRAARRYVTEHFNREEQAEEFRRLLRRVVISSRPQP